MTNRLAALFYIAGTLCLLVGMFMGFVGQTALDLLVAGQTIIAFLLFWILGALANILVVLREWAKRTKLPPSP